MTKFLNTTSQIGEIEGIFKNSKKKIVIISPYIDLPLRVRNELKSKIDNRDIVVVVIFRRDENKSEVNISSKDLEFFKEFKNVTIGCSDHLHAKYYGNENSGLSTSLNLIKSSFNNNSEIGIYVEKRPLLNLRDRIIDNPDDQFVKNLYGQLQILVNEIITGADIIFEKKIKKKKSLIKKDSSLPEIITDKTKELFTENNNLATNASSINMGFCIRSKKRIPFKITHPYCSEAYFEWVKSGSKKDMAEKYCHKTGKESNGTTCFNKPIMEM